MGPAVEIVPLDGDAPAAVGPRPRVVRIAAAHVAEAGAEAQDVRRAGDEGVAVDEAADLEGETVEEGRLRLRLRRGREGEFWGGAEARGRREGAEARGRREGAGSDGGQGSGLGFGYDAGSSSFSGLGVEYTVEYTVDDVAEETEEVKARQAQEM